VKRPVNKSRKSSALRTSFARSHDDDGEGEEGASTLVVPKRSNLSRVAIQRNAERRPASDLAFRAPTDSDSSRPSYSKDYLEALKQSTPSTPNDQSFRNTPEPATSANPGQALDVASKFGTDLSAYQLPTAIPSDAEIREKKERRARLAKEQEFISLDDGLDDESGDDEDDENVTRDHEGRLILKPKEKYAETRLVRDDEDMLEGFDDFTSDNRIGFGGAAEREAAKKRKAEMASLIADAEGQGDLHSDEDDSEAERNAAFEVAQTRHGNYGTRDARDEASTRPQTPPRIAPIPSLDSVVDRLRKRLEEMELARMAKTKEMQRLVQEKASIGEEEVRVQAALKETGERYSKLRDELRQKHPESQAPAHDGVGDDRRAEVDLVEARSGTGTPDFDDVSRRPFAGLGAS